MKWGNNGGGGKRENNKIGTTPTTYIFYSILLYRKILIRLLHIILLYSIEKILIRMKVSFGPCRNLSHGLGKYKARNKLN